jgi:hypothetical protein
MILIGERESRLGRDVPHRLAQAIAISLLAACTSSGSAESDKSPITTTETSGTTQQSSDREVDFATCTLEATAMVYLDPDKLTGSGQELNIALGFNFLSEVQAKDGTFGVERIENPLISECPSSDGTSVSKILSTGAFAKDTPVDGLISPISPTGVAYIDFFADGSYGVSAEARASIVTSTEEAWVGGMLDPTYNGSQEVVKVSSQVVEDDNLSFSPYDVFHAFVTAEGEEVMKRTFYPNMTIEQVSDMITGQVTADGVTV